MVEATVFTLTTRFTYPVQSALDCATGTGTGLRRPWRGMGRRRIHWTWRPAAGLRSVAEETITGTTLHLYGRDCLGQYADDEPALSGAEGYVRQGTDEQGEVVSAWLFDPDGTVLEGPQGLVSHLVCGGRL